MYCDAFVERQVLIVAGGLEVSQNNIKVLEVVPIQTQRALVLQCSTVGPNAFVKRSVYNRVEEVPCRFISRLALVWRDRRLPRPYWIVRQYPVPRLFL